MRRKKPEIFALAVEEAKKPGGLKVSQLVKKVGLSRQQIVRYLTELCEASILKREGKGPAVVYRFYDQIQPIVTVEMQTSDLGALSEDQFYQNLVRPHLDHLPKSTLSILNHGTTEMLNNIIDHSQSAQMTFSMSEDAKDIYVELTDDGIGIFEKNREAFGAKNLYEAVAETAKGRQTSAPEAHAGEGIFFTSRIFDRFELVANGIRWIFFSAKDDYTMEDVGNTSGTKVRMQIAIQTPKKIEEVFARYTDDQFEFNRGGNFLVKPYTIALGEEPVSRSEAKRLLQGADQFKHIRLDFKNTNRIGQGFADEIFRVFQSRQPQIILEEVNTSNVVQAMINHARSRLG